MTSATIPDHAIAFFHKTLARWLEWAEREPALTEVMYQDGETVVDIGGELIVDDHSTLTDTIVNGLANNAAVYAGEVVNREIPFLSVMTRGGWRVTFSKPPMSPRGPVMSCRRLLRQAIPLSRYVDDGIMTDSQAEELKQLVRMRKTAIISGSTSSGKTTLLRALLEMVERRERIVTLEAPCELLLTAEDGVRPRRHWVALESQPRGMSLGECLRASLRLRPDRIVVGECRGPEALELIRSVNTGHKGVMSTIHSNGAVECIDRLHSLCVEAQPTFPREIIERSVDAVIQIAGMGEHRKIEQIWYPGG